jgi:hypothetical protein
MGEDICESKEERKRTPIIRIGTRIEREREREEGLREETEK